MGDTTAIGSNVRLPKHPYPPKKPGDISRMAPDAHIPTHPPVPTGTPGHRVVRAKYELVRDMYWENFELILTASNYHEDLQCSVYSLSLIHICLAPPRTLAAPDNVPVVSRSAVCRTFFGRHGCPPPLPLVLAPSNNVKNPPIFLHTTAAASYRKVDQACRVVYRW